MRAPEPQLDNETRSLDDIVAEALEAFAKSKDVEEPKELREEACLPLGDLFEDQFIGGTDIEIPAEQLPEPNRGELFTLDFRSVVETAKVLFSARKAIPQWGYRRGNLKHLKILRERVAALQAALKAMPERVLFLLFAPDMSGTTTAIPSHAVQERVTRNLGMAVSTLLRLRKRCIELTAAEPGEHISTDFLQRWVAEEAVSLLTRHRKHVSNSSAQSLLRVTASLLFEAITGDPGKDLERACRTALQK